MKSSKREGACVGCGRPVAEHFDARNRYLTCEQLGPATPAVDDSAYMTWAQVTRYLGISKAALRQRIYRGTVPRTCWSTSLGEFRFIRSEIDRWMRQGTGQPTVSGLRIVK